MPYEIASTMDEDTTDVCDRTEDDRRACSDRKSDWIEEKRELSDERMT
ncbi:hypothetical protein [Natrinema ejinorense]|nr:hypothetical protein [Natrinema ejinorense]